MQGLQVAQPELESIDRNRQTDHCLESFDVEAVTEQPPKEGHGSSLRPFLGRSAWASRTLVGILMVLTIGGVIVGSLAIVVSACRTHALTYAAQVHLCGSHVDII